MFRLAEKTDWYPGLGKSLTGHLRSLRPDINWYPPADYMMSLSEEEKVILQKEIRIFEGGNDFGPIPGPEGALVLLVSIDTFNDVTKHEARNQYLPTKPGSGKSEFRTVYVNYRRQAIKVRSGFRFVGAGQFALLTNYSYFGEGNSRTINGVGATPRSPDALMRDLAERLISTFRE